MQCNHLLDLIFSHLGTSEVLGCSRQRDTGYLCDSVGKGVDLMPCYEGTPQKLRKDREDMFCAASIRLGLDLCLMGDLFSFSGFSYVCLICHASSAVLTSFK